MARIPPQVHKFGGASLASGAAIAHAVSIIRAHQPAPLVVVVSAMAGVTDALLELAKAAARGEAARAVRAAGALHTKHVEAARSMLKAGRVLDDVLEHVETMFSELDQLSAGLVALREMTARTSDYLVARGERLSARLVVAALENAGIRAAYVDAVDVVKSDGTFGGASPDLPRTERSARRVLGPFLSRGVVPVVPGFLAGAPDGQVATLGRGGSDLSATLLARALGARDVSLWKDVPGLLTADPRHVPDARVVPYLHVREAAELAYYGAKVLHPRALIPIMRKNVAIRIRPFADPKSGGTEISRRRAPDQYSVKAISAIPGQALLTVAGSGMLGVPGIAARTFAAVRHEGISVSLISQASSEHSISFSVPAEHADRARSSLRETFRHEISRQEIDGVGVITGAATLVVVGMGIAKTPGVAARVFAALSEAGVNIIAVAQGSSELNLSLVIDEREVAAALRTVHGAFELSKIGGGSARRGGRTDIVLLGFGRVGRALAPLIARHHAGRLRIVGVIDRSGCVFEPAGIPASRLATLGTAKAKGTAMAQCAGGRPGGTIESLGFIAQHALDNPILVDVTADDTSHTLLAALAAGMHVVLANKRPLAGPRRAYDALVKASASHGQRLLHEATVGAGLPIIDTYYKLLESGDHVLKIEGSASGTLAYLLGELGRGSRFSGVLRSAITKGYTEPDPRDDLSGLDVARKALILGRLLGFPGELADVAVESLVPRGAARLPLHEFLARLDEFDDAWQSRAAAVRQSGRVLRYVASVTRRSIRVGIVEAEAASSLGSLAGTDNQFIFTTRRYAERPLVITGPGAGPDVTAAGILNDVLRISRDA